MLKQSFIAATAVAGLLAAAPPAVGQEYQQPAAQLRTAETITVRPSAQMRRFYMPRQEIRDVRGQYLMEDGTTAAVDARQRSLIVNFDNRTTVLQPVGAYVFSSDNDDMTLVYTKDALGDDIIVLNYIPQRNLAMGEAGRIRLSSR